MRSSGLVAAVLVSGIAGTASADPVLWVGNGHYYEIVTTSLNWDAANLAAQSRSWLGVSGHLVTVTSASENLFLTAAFGVVALDQKWLGGFQPSGSPEPGGNWRWVTGEPFSFQGWGPGEPNNAGFNEDRIIFNSISVAWGKPWNDVRRGEPRSGYVVEYPLPAPGAAVTLAIGALVLQRRRRS